MIVGVVGHPIAHSLSPTIHNAALRHEGRDASYEAFDVEPADFDAFIREMQKKGARGLNVTIPHKAAAFAVCTTHSETAERTRAVNTIVFDGEIAGHNTDVYGVRTALTELDAPLDGVTVLIVGAGGAGRSAAWAVADRAGEIVIANRTEARAHELADAVGGSVVAWDDLERASEKAGTIIHATSVGLEDDASVLDLASTSAVILDLVYKPGGTALVRRARVRGLAAADGLSMLVHQAAEAYRLFWGTDPPVGVMRRAVGL